MTKTNAQILEEVSEIVYGYSYKECPDMRPTMTIQDLAAAYLRVREECITMRKERREDFDKRAKEYGEEYYASICNVPNMISSTKLKEMTIQELSEWINEQ